MPFVPRFNEAAESEIIENLMAVVDRDMKEALDHFYPTPALPDFAVKTDGDVSVFNYPLLILGVERMKSSETEEINETDEDVATYLNQELIVGAGMIVDDATSLKNVRAKAKKYVRAFKAVTRSASATDLFPATARISSYVIDIEHRYLRPGTKGTVFTQPIEFEIRIQFGET